MPTQQIKSRYDGRTLCEREADTLLEALQKGLASGSDLRGSNLSGSDLRGSNLSGSDLRGSDLRGSNLSGSDLRGSNLSYSNLSGSDLRGSNLSYSNLSGSDLRDVQINWQSHDFVAELLRRAAGDDVSKRSLAGLVLISRDWCWNQFLAAEMSEREWALCELRKWVQDGDNAPDVLQQKVAAPAE